MLLGFLFCVGFVVPGGFVVCCGCLFGGNLFNLGLFCCILCSGGVPGSLAFCEGPLKGVVVAGQPLTQTIC